MVHLITSESDQQQIQNDYGHVVETDYEDGGILDSSMLDSPVEKVMNYAENNKLYFAGFLILALWMFKKPIKSTTNKVTQSVKYVADTTESIIDSVVDAGSAVVEKVV